MKLHKIDLGTVLYWHGISEPRVRATDRVWLAGIHSKAYLVQQLNDSNGDGISGAGQCWSGDKDAKRTQY